MKLVRRSTVPIWAYLKQKLHLPFKVLMCSQHTEGMDCLRNLPCGQAGVFNVAALGKKLLYKHLSLSTVLLEMYWWVCKDSWQIWSAWHLLMKGYIANVSDDCSDREEHLAPSVGMLGHHACLSLLQALSGLGQVFP